MTTYVITVTEFNDDFVKYAFGDGGSGMSGRKWFPLVEIGQVWKMTCDGARVVSCEKMW